jgi:hypothetical protein
MAVDFKGNFRKAFAKAAPVFKMEKDLEERLATEPLMEYFANIPYILGSERPEDFAVRNLALIIGDHLGNWFPTFKTGTNSFLKRFEPIMHYPGVPREKVEPYFYSAMALMINHWQASVGPDKEARMYNPVTEEAVNFDALKESYIKQWEEKVDPEVKDRYSGDMWVRGWWMRG